MRSNSHIIYISECRQKIYLFNCYSVQWILNYVEIKSVHRWMYIVHCTLYIVHCTVYNVQWKWMDVIHIRFRCLASILILHNARKCTSIRAHTHGVRRTHVTCNNHVVYYITLGIREDAQLSVLVVVVGLWYRWVFMCGVHWMGVVGRWIQV